MRLFWKRSLASLISHLRSGDNNVIYLLRLFRTQMRYVCIWVLTMASTHLARDSGWLTIITERCLMRSITNTQQMFLYFCFFFPSLPAVDYNGHKIFAALPIKSCSPFTYDLNSRPSFDLHWCHATSEFKFWVVLQHLFLPFGCCCQVRKAVPSW